MDHDDDDGEPVRPWVPPDDRLWRHPSEAPVAPVAPVAPAAAAPAPRAAGRRAWPLALLSGAFGAVLAVAAIAAAGQLGGVQIVRTIQREATDEPGSPDAADWVVRAVERVAPAVVQLRVMSSNEGWSTGSGVVFGDDGAVLTSAHLVEGAEGAVFVTADGEDHEAIVRGTDPLTGVAVVQAKAPQGAVARPFRIATLGRASRLRVGQRAAVVGAGTGQGAGPEVAVGVVGALGKQVPNGDGEPLLDMIRADAKVPVSSAGGALVDDRGVVVGIVTAASGLDGVVRHDFATPIDVARDVADQILTESQVTYVWLGVEGPSDAWPAPPASPEGGALVQVVEPASPAGTAQIRPSDVIVAIKTGLSSRPVASMGELRMALRDYEPGQAVTVVVRRDGAEVEVPVTLAERLAS